MQAIISEGVELYSKYLDSYKKYNLNYSESEFRIAKREQ